MGEQDDGQDQDQSTARDAQNGWLQGLGVPASLFQSPSDDSGGDAATGVAPVSAGANGSDPDSSAQNLAATSLNLTPPQLTVPGPQAPNPAGDPPQLKLGLTPDEVAACDNYLAAHRFAAVLSAGGTPGNPGDYQPSLDGNPASIADVVQALLPLTAAGSANAPPADQAQVLIAQATAALFDLVKQRLNQAIVAPAVPSLTPAQPAPQADPNSPMYRQGYHEGAAGQAGQCKADATADETRDYEQGFSDGKAERDNFVNRVQNGLRDANKAAQASGKPPDQAWKQWRDAVKKWCDDHHVDTGPMLDSLQDLFNLPDDGTKLPPSQHGSSDPPTQDD